MLAYCLKCSKETESENPKVAETDKGKSMLLPKFAICDSKISRCMKQQETSGLLRGLKLKHLLDDILSKRYKMNNIINMFLLARDKFMLEMH